MAEEHFIEVGGNKLHGIVEGEEGKPWLTCLHTLASNLTLWDDQAPALAKDLRLLRLDARGHGQSTATNQASSISELAADVVGVWDALGVARSNVLGISLGGMTGVGLALEHGDRVEKLVAADCRLDSPQFFIDMWSERQRQWREIGPDAVVDATLPIWFSEKTHKERPDIVARGRAMITGTSEPGYFGASTALQRMDLKSKLGAIRCPTLYLCGELDGPHPREMQEFAELTPNAKYVEIPGASHASNLEAPAEFARIVLNFLKGA